MSGSSYSTSPINFPGGSALHRAGIRPERFLAQREKGHLQREGHSLKGRQAIEPAIGCEHMNAIPDRTVPKGSVYCDDAFVP